MPTAPTPTIEATHDNGYDQYKRKNTIKELRKLWLFTRMTCQAMEYDDDVYSTDLFQHMEHFLFITALKVEMDRYIDRKSFYSVSR